MIGFRIQTLTILDLVWNRIRVSGAEYLSRILTNNTVSFNCFIIRMTVPSLLFPQAINFTQSTEQ